MITIKRVDCPTCEESFNTDGRMNIGTRLLCPYCEEMLEVVRLNPLILDCVCPVKYGNLDEGGWHTGGWQ